MLTKALGNDKAAGLIERILQGGDTSGIEGLKWMDSAAVAELIRTNIRRSCHDPGAPGIATKPRSDRLFLPSAPVTTWCCALPRSDGIQPTALRELNDVLTKLLSGSENIKRSRWAAYAPQRKS